MRITRGHFKRFNQRQGGLAFSDIITHVFAEHLTITDKIEHVINDLKGITKVLTKFGEGVIVFRAIFQNSHALTCHHK